MLKTVPEADLEQMLIREFLRERGYDQDALDKLSEPERIKILSEASEFAGDRLAEVEARLRYLGDLHHSD